MFGDNPGINATLAIQNQQIARVYRDKKDDLTNEDKILIQKFFHNNDIAFTYQPDITNYIRNIFDFSYYYKNQNEYKKLWANLLIRYPKEYIKAFLALHLKYWVPDSVFIQENIKERYIENYKWETSIEGIERPFYLPHIHNFYYDFSQQNSWIQYLPIFTTVFSISTPIWVIMIVLLLCLVSNRKRFFLTLIPSIGVWGALHFAAFSIGRYIWPLMACYPLYLAIVNLSMNSYINNKELEEYINI